MATKHSHTSRKDGIKTRSSTYCSWENMKQRCLNPNHPSYHRYGGRGVKVHPRWIVFETFLEDMGEKPYAGWAISRNGDKGNYEPGNCCWKSKGNNSSEAHQGVKSHLSKITEDMVLDIRKLYLDGRTQKYIADHYNLSQSTVSAIVLGKTWKHIHTEYIKKKDTYNYSEGKPKRGESVNAAKLTVNDVKIIKKLVAQGITQTQLAKQFKVSQPTISAIVLGKTWADVNQTMAYKRDYKREYENYDSREDVKKRRAARNKARRFLEREGRVHKGDGKDVDHRDGNPHNNDKSNLRVMNASANRSRKHN